MELKQQINEDMKTAMRAKDAPKLSVIRMLLAAIKQVEIDQRIELTDADVISIITKMIKQRNDSVKIYREAKRDDMADKEAFEIRVLEDYMPTQMADAEIEPLVIKTIEQVGANSMADMGKVMGVLKPQLAGKADMTKVSQLIKAALQAK